MTITFVAPTPVAVTNPVCETEAMDGSLDDQLNVTPVTVSGTASACSCCHPGEPSNTNATDDGVTLMPVMRVTDLGVSSPLQPKIQAAKRNTIVILSKK